jgi:N-acyl-D-amino-acid deacylase
MPTQRPRCDLAIVDGRVLDGKGTAPTEAAIGIRGDRVVQIGGTIDADHVIDAKGALVAPGFIDLHGHSDFSVFLDPLCRSKLLQGVTTEVNGNCGVSAAPIWGQVAAEKVDEYRRNCALELSWSTMGEYLSAVDTLRPALNIVPLIGYNTIRSAATADRAGAVSPSEMAVIRAAIGRALDEGGAGISVGLAYPSACFSDVDELVEAIAPHVARLQLYGFHIRDEGDELVEAIDEALEVGTRSGVRVQISHIKTFGPRNWWKLPTVVKRLERARAAGLDVAVDRYPYTAMNTALMTVFPKWSFDGGEEHLRKTILADVAQRAQLRRELVEILRRMSPDKIVLAAVGLPQNKRFEGLSVEAAAASLAKESVDFVMDLVAEEGLAAFATFFGMSDENLAKIVSLPYAMIASDASIQAPERGWGGLRPHPRAFGTFPHFLGEFVREKGLFDIAEGVRRVTSMPAERIGLRERGVLGEGSFADIVMLREDLVGCPATYETPVRSPVGIERVIVNGKVAVEHGTVVGGAAGRALRGTDAELFVIKKQ